MRELADRVALTGFKLMDPDNGFSKLLNVR